VYAVIQTGGKQYKVASGDKIKVEKIDAPVGSKVKIPNVLMIYGDNELKIDATELKQAFVRGTILAQGKNKKVIVFKKKRRKGFQKKKGHRQTYTEVLIESINLQD